MYCEMESIWINWSSYDQFKLGKNPKISEKGYESIVASNW